jgi:hypothetical protein
MSAPREAIAAAFNAVGPALAESGDWLPLSVRQRLADAVLAAAAPHWHCQSCDGHSCDEPATP